MQLGKAEDGMKVLDISISALEKTIAEGKDETATIIDEMAALFDGTFGAELKQASDPAGACPFTKTWDELGAMTGSGKEFFHEAIPGDKVSIECFYVAIIALVIY